MTTQEQPAVDRSSRKAAEWLWPLAPIGVSVFCLSALLYYNAHFGIEPRTALQIAIAGIYGAIGLAPSVLFFLLVLTWSSIWFATGRLDRPLVRLGRLLAMAVMLGVFLNLGDGGVPVAPHKGALGAWLAERLVSAFGYVPSMIVVWAVTFASLLLATDFFFGDSFERLRRRAPAPETGVETAVTDYLRGLESLTPATAGGPAVGNVAAGGPAIGNMAAGTGRTVWLPEPRFATAPVLAPESAPAERADESRVDESPAESAEQRRRRSYFARRRDEELPVEVDAPAAATEPPVGEAPTEVAPTEVAPTEVAPTEDAAREADQRQLAADAVSDFVDVVDEDGAGIHAANLDDDADIDDDLDDEIVSAPPAASEADADLLAIEAATTEAAEVSAVAEKKAEEPAEEEEHAEDPEEDSEEDSEEDPEEDGDVPAEDREAVVRIPRPDPAPVSAALADPTPARIDEAPAGRQRGLFGGVDEAVVEEAVELLAGARRVTAGLLQRRLRVDYPQALEVLAQLAARGLVQLDADASQGRVVV